uniref:tRNA (uracil(54)-C(5))-methyltransferase n=1 Tax=Meloidogyne incognita TaxID=6306 RepID=A0A914L4I1_MELIC
MEENKQVYRVKLTNLPKYMGFADINKFVKNNLGKIGFSKLKYNGHVTFFNLASEEDAIESAKILNNSIFKKENVNAEVIVKKGENEKKPVKNANTFKTAADMVTPLANMPYEEQLEFKFNLSHDIMLYIIRKLNYANVYDTFCYNVLQKVLPAPSITAYRNKCEFTIGYSKSKDQFRKEKKLREEVLEKQKLNEGEEKKEKEEVALSKSIIAGFINGKMNNGYRVLPIEGCKNLSLNTINVVKYFEEFVNEFDERPFNEFSRKGFWKMLTVKDFLGDCMLIVTVHPHTDKEICSKIKQRLVEKFLHPQNPEDLLPDCNVTSIFWQEQVNSSDDKNYEHLAGPPFVYESLLGCNFRISPSTFFQTNSTGAAVLYSAIGDLLKLPKLINATGSGKFCRMEKLKNNKNVLKEEEKNVVDKLEDNKFGEEDKEECNAKKPRLDEEKIEEKELDKEPQKHGSNVFLDICCGSGSISICLMARIRQSIQEGTISDYSKLPYGCVGIDLNTEAIQDARRNASENGFDDKSCKFLCGQAEGIFKDLKYYLPTGCSIKDANIMGILDPPRAGIPDKAIIGCRKLEQLKTLIYVSCDPHAATKNFVDLCRPMSCKFDGQPFKIVAIQPVDLFPMTRHLEWIVKFERC